MDIIVPFPVVYSTKNRYKSPSNKDEVFSAFRLHPSALKNAYLDKLASMLSKSTEI